jgi:CspA family cold shock protein
VHGTGLCLDPNLLGKGYPMASNGTVKFFNHTKGYGFIAPEDGGKDIFVHISALERAGLPPLNEGDRVSFEVEDDPRGRGKQATNIQMA